MMASLIQQARVRGPHPDGPSEDRIGRIIRARVRLFGLVAGASLLIFPLMAVGAWVINRALSAFIVWRWMGADRRMSAIQGFAADTALVMLFALMFYALLRLSLLISGPTSRHPVSSFILRTWRWYSAAAIVLAIILDALLHLLHPRSLPAAGTIMSMSLFLLLMLYLIVLSLHATSDAHAVLKGGRRERRARYTRQAEMYHSDHNLNVSNVDDLDNAEIAREIVRHKAIVRRLEEAQSERRNRGSSARRKAR